MTIALIAEILTVAPQLLSAVSSWIQQNPHDAPLDLIAKLKAAHQAAAAEEAEWAKDLNAKV